RLPLSPGRSWNPHRRHGMLNSAYQTAQEPALADLETLHQRFQQVRATSESLCAPLEIDDYGIQSMPDVSPPKWHLAHVSWFFETFLLKPYLPGYKALEPVYDHLFNS